MGEWIQFQFTSISSVIFILLALSLVITSIGFLRIVLFISLGYAFSITAMVVVTALMFHDKFTWITALQSAGLLVWSLRLGAYLLQREAQPAYQARMIPIYERSNKLPFKAKFFIWISVSLLYAAMFTSSLFALTANAPASSVFAQVVGVVVMFGGLMIETLADKQKAALKAASPQKFCNVGLFKIVRYPSYLGEILLWVGNFVIGLTFFSSLLQVAIALIGVVCITLIMMGSTKRMEESQGQRYGESAEYQRYITTTPVLIPFLPIYTLKNIRVYIE